MNINKYYRAVGIAEFIIEGHTLDETKEEFRISKDTITRDLNFLLSCLYGNHEYNIKLYIKAKQQLKKNIDHSS